MDRRTVLATIGLAGSSLIGQRPGSNNGEVKDEVLREILPGTGAKARAFLIRALDTHFDGTLSAEDAREIAALESKPVNGLMVNLLPLAATFSRPSISKFHVGALLRGVSGRLYFGANLELAGRELGATVHAEQSAAANAYMHREEGFSALAVTAAPCGLCRQFLWEMCYGSELQILTRGHLPSSLANLLPDAFGPGDLGLKKGALPVTQTPLQLQDAKPSEIATVALEAAQMSYAPYTKAFAGVAIKTAQGRIYPGAYIENAAYNPSLSPLQTALAGLTIARDDPSHVVQAVLVEVPGRPISHRSAVENHLSAIAPKADLSVLLAVAGR